MSEFYGQVFGTSQTPASRCGSKNSGIKVSAQSWKGSVIVSMTGDDPKVSIEINEGSNAEGTLYFHGTITELKNVLIVRREL